MDKPESHWATEVHSPGKHCVMTVNAAQDPTS